MEKRGTLYIDIILEYVKSILVSSRDHLRRWHESGMQKMQRQRKGQM